MSNEKLNLDLCDSDSVKFDPFNDSQPSKSDPFKKCKSDIFEESSLSSKKTSVDIPEDFQPSPITTNVLPKAAPKFLPIQNFLITLAALLISIYISIISYSIYTLICIIPYLKNSEAAEKLSSDTIGIIGLTLLGLIFETIFIFGIQRSKEWLLLSKSIYAFIITIFCFLVTVIWMNKNLFNGPYDIEFWLTYFTIVPFCFLQFASGIISMNFFIKLIYENTTQNTIRIINQPPDYYDI